MTESADRPVVLAVDDEPEVLNVIEGYLADTATVRTADGGEAALAGLDESIDVVLLDRLMPDMHGDEILEEIRSRGFDCGVIMVSAVKPDIDIATLQYNEYLVKPISKDELHRSIERVSALSERDVQVQEYFALADKIHALENGRIADKSNDEAVDQLRDRMRRLQERIEPGLTPLEERIADNLAAKWPQDQPTVARTT